MGMFLRVRNREHCREGKCLAAIEFWDDLYYNESLHVASER